MKRVEQGGLWSLMCPNECPGLVDSWGEDFERRYEAYEAEGKARLYSLYLPCISPMSPHGGQGAPGSLTAPPCGACLVPPAPPRAAHPAAPCHHAAHPAARARCAHAAAPRVAQARKAVKAQELWFAILDAQIETGTPYMLYKDACNRKSNQQNLGCIKVTHPHSSGFNPLDSWSNRRRMKPF